MTCLKEKLNRYRAIATSNKLRVISGQKSSKEETFGKITSEIKQFDDERTMIRNEINLLEREKSKLMTAANDYSQAKSTIDSELRLCNGAI